MKKHPVDGAGARARTLRQNMTEAERWVWQILRSHQMKGYKFRRQAPIGHYIADFVCHEARLIVEIDGVQQDRSSPREAERSGFLENQGYRILQFWNNEVLAGTVARADAILHPGGLASRRAQAQGVARSLHRRCPHFMPRRKNVPRRELRRELTPLGELAILEDRRYLEMRVARLDTGMAWAEDPPSRTRHLIGNLEAAPLENGEVEAKTAFSGVPLAPGDRSPAPLRLARGRATQGERRVEGIEAHDRARRQRPAQQEPQRLPLRSNPISLTPLNPQAGARGNRSRRRVMPKPDQVTLPRRLLPEHRLECRSAHPSSCGRY